MSQCIDRRQNAGKKSTVNRQRFLRRYKQHIKRAVSDAMARRGITDIEKGEKVSIPSKDISEPFFKTGQGGQMDYILPGNQDYMAGDTILRPPKSPADSGKGSDAGQSESGEDSFSFELTREEFLSLYFEDLELPDLIKKNLLETTTFKTVRAGITASGTPANINVVRSMRQAAGRRIALGGVYRQQLKEKEKQLKSLESAGVTDDTEVDALTVAIQSLKRRLKKIPFIDTFDLRYNYRVRVAVPATSAVMFCIMDVSGSMDEAKKNIAKQFFILLYLFLNKNYKKIELVFIRHHTSAKEVTEEEFFYSRETGGTVVSSALTLLYEIIQKRYPQSDWNIYVAQASDGDNWNADSPYCQALLQEKIMRLVQYYAYIEIMPRHHQSLWEVFLAVKKQFPQFAMENIDTAADIYPVLRTLFKRKVSS